MKMNKKYVAYDSVFAKLMVKVEEDEVNLEIKGLLSPFLKNTKSKLEDQIKDSNFVLKNDKIYLSSSFPPIPSFAFKRLFKNEIKRFIGFNYPNNLTIMVTGECECDCEHCLASEMIGEHRLSKKDIKRLIDQALDLGVTQIVFEGGEPTLREDLPELVNYVDERATTMVVTNGANLDEEYLDRLEKGLDYLLYSLDSPYPEKHNQFRKRENLFQKVKEGIKKSVERDILTGILYIAHPGNSDYKHLKDLVDLGRSLGVFEVMIDEIVDSGSWREGNVLDEEDKARIKQFNEELLNQDIKILNNFFLLRETENFGCFAGKRWFYASPTGEIMPCMHTPISFGNIKDKSLKEIWKKIRSNSLFHDASKCVYEKEKYEEEILPKMLEKNQFPYKMYKNR
ncbi:hypothetical protein C9439_06510 [archaeon SCG-AAA382B04]|nr:hypothetical protein C9439_06510 [archaeon SCG-AAA382B04]